MGYTDMDDVEKVMKELIYKAEVILTLDENGNIIGGFARKEGELRQLTPCKDLFNGERVLEGLSSISLVKVSSSPGHWVPCGNNNSCWVPR